MGILGQADTNVPKGGLKSLIVLQIFFSLALLFLFDGCRYHPAIVFYGQLIHPQLFLLIFSYLLGINIDRYL